MSIILCPRCKKKYIDVAKDRLCASCYNINPFTRQSDEEIAQVYMDATEWARYHGAAQDEEGNWWV